MESGGQIFQFEGEMEGKESIESWWDYCWTLGKGMNVFWRSTDLTYIGLLLLRNLCWGLTLQTYQFEKFTQNIQEPLTRHFRFSCLSKPLKFLVTHLKSHTEYSGTNQTILEWVLNLSMKSSSVTQFSQKVFISLMRPLSASRQTPNDLGRTQRNQWILFHPQIILGSIS